MQEVMPVFRVLRLVRDSRSTRNSDRELLIALAMRCQRAKKYMSWPSYRQLALDTQLDDATLKRAARRLEEQHIIKRVVRANRSNVFYINVALLEQQAARVKESDNAEKLALAAEDASPFGDPVLTEDTEPETDANDNEEPSSWMSGGAR